jgi:hypothetical protein
MTDFYLNNRLPPLISEQVHVSWLARALEKREFSCIASST